MIVLSIIVIFILFAVSSSLVFDSDDDSTDRLRSVEERHKARRRAWKKQRIGKVGMWIFGGMLGCFLLYGLGWIWYYFCGGGIAFEVADGPVEFLVYFIMSIVVFILGIGFVVGAFIKNR